MWLRNSTTWVVVCLVVGIIVPWWPLGVVAIGIAALFGNWGMALFCGLLLDLIWGRPLGMLAVIPFPMTLLAVITSCLRVLGMSVLLSKMPDRL